MTFISPLELAEPAERPGGEAAERGTGKQDAFRSFVGVLGFAQKGCPKTKERFHALPMQLLPVGEWI
jgi:hypothetical protein